MSIAMERPQDIESEELERQMAQIEQSEKSTEENRLIVHNAAQGWTGPWRLLVKWNLFGPHNKLIPMEQILEPNQVLDLGSISKVGNFEYAAYGEIAGKASLNWIQFQRYKLDALQVESKPKEAIVIEITTPGTGLQFNEQVVPFEKMIQSSALFTGKFIDGLPTVKRKILEKISADQFSRLASDQLHALIKKLIDSGFIEPRHFLGLPPQTDKEIIKHVFAALMAQWESRQKQNPMYFDAIEEIKDYLQRAYYRLMHQ